MAAEVHGDDVGVALRSSRGPRVPPLLIPLMLAVAAAAAFALLQPGPAVNPDLYWQVALWLIAFNGFPAALILPRTWAAVQVSEDGLLVRGRCVVPANELGVRQNLYAGWADIGPVVSVEHRYCWAVDVLVAARAARGGPGRGVGGGP